MLITIISIIKMIIISSVSYRGKLIQSILLEHPHSLQVIGWLRNLCSCINGENKTKPDDVEDAFDVMTESKTIRASAVSLLSTASFDG